MDVTQPCIKIQVHSKYIAEQSNPAENHYIFAYLVTIKNLSRQTVQLISRRWLSTDANGKQVNVAGDGVVGQQPFIDGLDEYSYSSGTAIETPVGVMQGQYIMLDEKGQQFIAEIDPFRLAIPNVLN